MHGTVRNREVFGPVASLERAADATHAFQLANDTEYGLVTAIFSRDVGEALDALNSIHTGLIRINGPTTGVDYWAPFGGSKRSGFGPREQGLAARDFYTETRTILFQSGPS